MLVRGLLLFLKSNKFTSIIRSVVDEQTTVLCDEFTTLRSEIDILKTTNIDLIKLLTNSKQLLSNYQPVPLNARSSVVNKASSEPVSDGHLFASRMECDIKKM